MKVGLFPGSFNPWHEGHEDVLNKALSIFDKVVVAIGNNAAKETTGEQRKTELEKAIGNHSDRIEIVYFEGLLADFVRKRPDITSMVRGMRDTGDLEFEKTMLYWNEDLGIKIPTAHFICDRSLVHISSSAIRMTKPFRK